MARKDDLKKRTRFHRFIVEHLNLDELQTLCFELSVNYDDLAGEALSGKARELILRLGRERRLDELLGYLREVRPKAFAEASLDVSPAMSDATYAETSAKTTAGSRAKVARSINRSRPLWMWVIGSVLALAALRGSSSGIRADLSPHTPVSVPSYTSTPTSTPVPLPASTAIGTPTRVPTWTSLPTHTPTRAPTPTPTFPPSPTPQVLYDWPYKDAWNCWEIRHGPDSKKLYGTSWQSNNGQQEFVVNFAQAAKNKGQVMRHANSAQCPRLDIPANASIHARVRMISGSETVQAEIFMQPEGYQPWFAGRPIVALPLETWQDLHPTRWVTGPSESEISRQGAEHFVALGIEFKLPQDMQPLNDEIRFEIGRVWVTLP